MKELAYFCSSGPLNTIHQKRIWSRECQGEQIFFDSKPHSCVGMLSQLWSKTLSVSRLWSSFLMESENSTHHQTINYIQFPELIKSFLTKISHLSQQWDYHFIMFKWSTVFCQYPSDFCSDHIGELNKLWWELVTQQALKHWFLHFYMGHDTDADLLSSLGRGGRFRDFHLAFPTRMTLIPWA